MLCINSPLGNLNKIAEVEFLILFARHNSPATSFIGKNGVVLPAVEWCLVLMRIKVLVSPFHHHLKRKARIFPLAPSPVEKEVSFSQLCNTKKMAAWLSSV